MKKNEIKKAVRESYAKVATKGLCCGPTSCNPVETTETSCCNIGYSEQDAKKAPDGSNLGLGCGNPVALASLKQGEVVLDLGAGAGFDCFLAADRVGKNGRVIGVDMTPEMIDKARGNAEKSKYQNVEFRLGEIENLPAADASVDVVISNCVINLSVDKKQVFKEAFRVLKPGGRMMISDLVLYKELPDAIKKSVVAYVGCVAGAMLKDDYIKTIKDAGFGDVKILAETPYAIDVTLDDRQVKEVAQTINLEPAKVKELSKAFASVSVYAVKPKK